MRYCRCLRFQFRSRYFHWNGNCHGLGEHENHRTSQRVILVAATGHPASHTEGQHVALNFQPPP